MNAKTTPLPRPTLLRVDLGQAQPAAPGDVAYCLTDVTTRRPDEPDVQYRPMFQSNPMPMWVYSPTSLRFLAVNDAAVRHYGFSRDEFLALSIEDIRPPETIPALHADLAKASPSSGGHGVWTHRRKDGSLIEVEITASDIPFSGCRARLVLAHDVTARRKAEMALRMLNADLERRVDERTARLEAALKELEAFSYSVSHDLRAPLRGIDGFARALLEDCDAQLDAEGRRLLNVIRGETRRMAQLIDDVLTFSRTSRQPIDACEVDMTALARSAFDSLLESQPTATARLTLGELPQACGDRSMLRQVFANLCGNAIKFSSRHAEPRVEITGWREGARTVYCVHDNGVGFDSRFAHKLFGLFQRLHRHGEFDGTGVGLAIVQRVIHRHGGTVWAHSNVNAGASFYFTLPTPAGTAG